MYSTTADGDDFVEIASGIWENNKTLKVVDFDLVNARRIRLVAASTLCDSANTFISAAEIAVVKEVKELEKIEDTHITGDVNGDGRVEVDNATLIQEYLVLLADDINLEYADLNNDSKITVMDATIVQMIVSGVYDGQ